MGSPLFFGNNENINSFWPNLLEIENLTNGVMNKNFELDTDISNPNSLPRAALYYHLNASRLPHGFLSIEIDEKEEKKLKRKQSNRESARRSRLRKQAEVEELQKRNFELTHENRKLRLEMDTSHRLNFCAMNQIDIYAKEINRLKRQPLDTPIILSKEKIKSPLPNKENLFTNI